MDVELGTEYPADWETPRLEDVCFHVINGYVGPTRNIYRRSGIPYIVSKNVKPNRTITEPFGYVDEEFQQANQRSILRKGDVLTVQTGSIGDSGVVPKLLENANCHALIISRPMKDLLNPFWLCEYFNSYFGRKEFTRLATGLAHPHLNTTSVRKMRIPLPPIEEQNAIVEILCTINDIVHGTVLFEIQALKKSLMQRLLTRGIGHTRFKKTRIGEIPESWELIMLRDVASSERNSFVDGPFGSNLKVSDQTESGVRLIQLQNIGEGAFLNEYKRYTSEAKFAELKRHATYPGNIVIAKMANPVARACLVPPVEEKFLVVADCMRLRVDEKRFDPQFVVYAINSTAVRVQAIRRSTGTTRLRISLTSLKGIAIPHPPKEEQAQIASVLLRIDELLQNECFQVGQLEILKKGLMQILLTGKVRVKV